MSILRSMSIGLSGMASNSNAMGAISNNIANVNTVGFKQSRANFSEVFASTAMGVGITSVQQSFAQGALESTGNVTDLAISGPGFLVVRGEVNGEVGSYYTRAGQFVIDKNGFISNAQGMRLQGYSIGGDGDLSPTTGDLDVGNHAAPPSPTSLVSTRVNLNAEATVQVGAFDPTDPLETSNYSTSVTLYDSVGRAIQADVYYRKTDTPNPNTWEYHILVDGETVDGGTPGAPHQIMQGTLEFDNDGNMIAHTPDTAGYDFVPAHQTESPPLEQEIEFDFSATQYVGSSDMKHQSQNGYAVGELRGLNINDDGMIYGSFSNGETLLIGQVAMANFRAPEGLEQLSNNMWRASQDSGEVLMGVPGVGGRGGLVSGALEGSNVDLAHEFVKMIAVQRGFQSNSKTIQTGDQLMQEVLTLKR